MCSKRPFIDALTVVRYDSVSRWGLLSPRRPLLMASMLRSTSRAVGGALIGLPSSGCGGASKRMVGLKRGVWALRFSHSLGGAYAR